MKIAMFPAPTGSAYWRMIDPAKYLRRRGFDVEIIETGINEDIIQWADVCVLENCVDKEGIALLHAYQQTRGKKIVSDWDDFIISNSSSPYKKLHQQTQFPEVAQITIGISDMITVTTKYLKKKYSKYNNNIRILPNSMDMDRWKKPKRENKSGFIRIGWAGSLTHMDDLKMVQEPLKRIMREFDNVQLVLVGEMRSKDLFEGYNVESMVGVPFDYWPDKLSGLQLDIGIAPLKKTEFNKCKSNIKWQEYSISRVAGVFSPTVYEGSSQHVSFDGNLGLIADSNEQWYQCIKNYIVCPNLREDIANHAYSFVTQEYSLENNIKDWVKAYSKLTQ